nr:hypothetical protein [Tanacetum cinerariifolium]
MLHICPRIPNQTFDELLFEEEILPFLRNLGQRGEIKKITDVNINKLHQPWRSFAVVINKCLSGKSTVYQVEHKDAKNSNEIYYPRFTKVIINFFMTKDQSIPRRNKFGAMLPVELTNKDIRNSTAYKEYYAIALGAKPPKTKASVRKTQNEGTGIIPGVPDIPTYESNEEISWKSSDEDDDDVDDQSNDDASHGMNVGGDEGPNAEGDDNELYGDVNINLEGRDVQMTDVHTTQFNPSPPPPSIPTSSQVQQAPAPSPTTAPSTFLQDLLNFGSLFAFNHHLKTLEANFSKFMQTNQFAKAVSFILGKEPESTNAPKEKASKTSGKSTEGSKSHQKTACESAPAEEPMKTTQDLEEPAHLEFETGATDDQPIAEASQHPEWFQNQKKPPTLDRDWNMTLPATYESIQPWISDLAKRTDSRTSFNELMDTHVHFSAFLMNRLKVDTSTPESLAGPTYELIKGSCKRVTYTDISSPFEELSDIGSPRADDHENLMLPEMLEDPYVEVALQAPPSPDYIHGPEEPEQAPPSPDYVLSPEHADDEIIAEDQPYAEDASLIAQSPEYVPESDFEAHPEDDDDEDPEEDPVDYPAVGGDDGDDEEESSEDDEDDEMDIEANEEEEEHPAPADSIVVAPTAADQAPSAEETEPFETDESAATPPPHPTYRTTARISIPAPLPSASRREDRPEVTLPPRKRLDIALGPRYEVGESSSAAAARPAGGFMADYGFVATVDREIMRDPEREVGYGITDSWDEIVETLQGAPVSTDTELGGYVREFETRVRQDTDEIYMRLDDKQTERQLLAGRLNMLFRDRRAHAYTCQLMETEARMSREAWVRATDARDLVHGEVMSLRTTVLGQMSEIRELQAADRRRQTVISELLMIDHRRSTEILELRTALQGQGLAGDHTRSELPEEAGGSA